MNDVKETTIPKINNIFHDETYAPDQYRYKIRHKSKFQGEVKDYKPKRRQRAEKSEVYESKTEEIKEINIKKQMALRRREDAKRNIMLRRQKLGLALRMAW